MTKLQRYLAEEIAIDHADGLITRREALRRLGLLGMAIPAASALLAACASDSDTGAAPTGPATTAAPTSPTPRASGTPVPTENITFAGPSGRRLMGAWAPAASPRGGLLVIHENRGLTDHIRSVAGRFAGEGYSALALDLLSEEGGTASFSDSAQATAALNSAPESRFVADMKAAISEIERRTPGAKLAATGFCFGGAMIWLLLHSGEPRLAAAIPFYGTPPDNPDFSKSKAAVFGIYAERDARVNATREEATAALQRANLVNQITIYPGVDHAFFNDTGPRYNAQQAALAYQHVLVWLGRHVG